MKLVYGSFILSDGSAIPVRQPPLRLVSAQNYSVRDPMNHSVWSGQAAEYKTEISKFVKRFKLGKS